jgi:TRAP transporter 4TM/12TM fusion protein
MAGCPDPMSATSTPLKSMGVLFLEGKKDVLKQLVTALAVVTGLYHLYVAAFGASSTMGLRITHWVFIGATTFLAYPTVKKRFAGSKWVEIGLASLAVLPGVYLLLTEGARVSTVRLPTTPEMVLGVILIGTVLEAARRSSGWTLPIIGAGFLAYDLFGHYLPGVLGHRQYSLARIVQYLFFSSDGVYGIPLGVSASYIVLFVLFGSFLSVSGAGQLFIDVVLGVTGKRQGGSAKAAVLSSALMGMITGSPVANVVTVGTYTIPLMKRSGYKDYEAAAVEAVASTGGMIMPPIMGAAAFIMADYLGVAYAKVALAATIPAVLYYLSLYWSIHFRAHRDNHKMLSGADLPDVRESLRGRWFLLIPVVLLIALLVIGWTATKAAFGSIVALLVIMVLMPGRKTLLSKLIAGMEDGVRSVIPITAATAVAGIIVGVISQTGLGVKFSTFMVDLAGGSPLLILIATMIASLILGMGLPATAVYVLLAALSAPALIKVGFSPMASHMFVFYFGIISAITPPVAMAAWAAAGVSKSDPNKTGWSAFRLGAVAYLVPFMFMYNSALLMQGSLLTIIQVSVTAILGVSLFAIGSERYLDRLLTWWETVLVIGAAILLLTPEGITDLVGIGLLAVFLILHFIVLRRKDPAEGAIAQETV